MPHKCTKCGIIYKEGSEEILKGCSCGNRKFIYFRKLSDKEAEELKKTVKEVRTDKGIWNIKVEDGVYEIDVASLMLKEPIIVAGEEGRYLVSLSSAFRDKGKKIKYTERI